MSTPPNMQPHQYERLQELKKRIATLNENEMKDLKDLSALSISHLEIRTARK